MKKAIINFILAAIIMCSCGVDRSDIEKACNQGNFEEAYRLAEELPKHGDFDSNDGIRFVAERECKYVLENMGEDGVAKVAIIAGDHYVGKDNLLKYAIALNNESMAIKLYKMYKKNISITTIQYAIAADMEDVVMLAVETDPEVIENSTIATYLKEKGSYDELVLKALNKEYEALATQKIDGSRPPLGLHRYWFGSEIVRKDSHPHTATQENVNYYHSLLKYNADCSNLLEKAIALKQLEMAKKIVLLVKQSIKITIGDSDEKIYVNKQRVDGNHSYIQSDDTDIKNAKQRLADAIREGAFN